MAVGEGDNRAGEILQLDPAVGLSPIGFGPEAEAVVIDWFGRGEPDLLVTAATGPRGRSTRVYRCIQPRHYEAGTPVADLDGLCHLCALPNGGPTRFDLVAEAPEGLVLLRNSGTAESPAFNSQAVLGPAADLGIGPGRIAQMVAEDWDGDGVVDLLIGFDDLDGYWPDGGVPRSQQVGFNQQAGHPGYDRAGAWRGRPAKGRLFWLRNVGSPGEPRFERPEEIGSESGSLDLAARPAPLLVSWGVGRTTEVLLADARGQLRLFRNFGGQRPPVLLDARTLQHDGRPMQFPEDRTTIVAADLDGDGRIGLLFGTSDGRVFAIHAGSGRDEVGAPELLRGEGRTLWVGGGAVVAAGDLDGDGDIDLIVGDAAGRVSMVEDLGAPGDPRYALPVELEAGGLPFRVDPGPDGRLGGPAESARGYACPTLVDWHGSNRLDMLIGTAGGEVLYLRNNGGPRQPRWDRAIPIRCEGHPLIGPPRVRPAVADWYGRGELDVLALDLQGFLCVYPRADKNDVGPPAPLVDRLGRLVRLDGGFGRAGRCTLWAGDWSGTGRVDLLVGLPRGSRHVVPAITGEPLVDLDDVPTVLLLENAGRGVVVPRPLRLADGRPLVVGWDGCSPNGVGGSGPLDLCVGSDDGFVHRFRREELAW